MYGSAAAWDCAFVTTGTLADGRWFADHTKEQGAIVCSDEAEARRLAAEWTAGDGWAETPASYDARHEPVDKERWRRVGGTWVLKDEQVP